MADTVQLKTGEQLDGKVVKVMRAIRDIESGGDYNAVGDLDKGVSRGAYQFNKDNFKTWASEYGLDPNDFSPANQNKVAYARMKKLKDEGKQPEEIAAIWNGAKKTPDGRYTYVNPEYGVKFRTALQKQIGTQTTPGAYTPPTQTGGYNPTPYSGKSGFTPIGFSVPLSDEPKRTPGFVGDVQETLGKSGQKISEAVTDTMSGKINPLQGVLRGAGGIASGVSGLATDILSAVTPDIVEKPVTEAVGKVAQAVAETPVGMSALNAWNSFSTEHPELAKDLGAVVDIASVVPTLKAGSMVAKGVGSAAKATGRAITATKTGTRGLISKGVLGTTMAKGAQKKFLQEAEEILQTKPTLKETREALRYGRGAVADGIPTIYADPLKRQSIEQVAKLVQEGKVGKGRLAVENAQAIKSAADSNAELMRALIREQDVQRILSPEDLKGLATKVEKRAGKGLPSGENPAKDLMDEFYENLPKGRDITAEDILNARQAVSRYVEQQKGDWRQRGVQTGFMKARDAVWDETRTLLKELAPDVPIEEMLKQQTALYRSLDYLAPSAKSELGTTALQRFGQQHPGISGLINLGVKGAAAGVGLKGVDLLP